MAFIIYLFVFSTMATVSSSQDSYEAYTDWRIVNGTNTEIETAPYMVLVELRRGRFCGGALTTVQGIQIVLTAAHCVRNIGTGDLRIVAGANTRTMEEGTRLEVRKIIVHEEYDSDTGLNDIAILVPEKEFELSEKIAPVDLPARRLVLKNSEDLFVTGWGMTSYEGKASDILQGVYLPVITNEDCSELYSDIPPIPPTQFCTYVDNKDACQGDSGGPAVTTEKEKVLVGIVKGGRGCAFKDSPGIFTRVSEYVDWIEQNAPGRHEGYYYE